MSIHSGLCAHKRNTIQRLLAAPFEETPRMMLSALNSSYIPKKACALAQTFYYGGELGIRTLGSRRNTAFRVLHLRPLGQLSASNTRHYITIFTHMQAHFYIAGTEKLNAPGTISNFISPVVVISPSAQSLMLPSRGLITANLHFL